MMPYGNAKRIEKQMINNSISVSSDAIIVRCLINSSRSTICRISVSDKNVLDFIIASILIAFTFIKLSRCCIVNREAFKAAEESSLLVEFIQLRLANDVVELIHPAKHLESFQTSLSRNVRYVCQTAIQS